MDIQTIHSKILKQIHIWPFTPICKHGKYEYVSKINPDGTHKTKQNKIQT